MSACSQVFSLSDEVRSLIFNFLWFRDLCALESTCKYLNEAIRQDEYLWDQILGNLFERTGRSISHQHNARFLSRFVDRITTWPTNIDAFSSAERKFDMIHPSAPNTRSYLRSIVYNGRLGNNHAVVACDHFPVLDSTVIPLIESEVRSSKVPFLKSSVCRESSRSTVQLSCIAYFEISIKEKRNPTKRPRQRLQEECVCIGIATPTFPLETLMPGWDGVSNYKRLLFCFALCIVLGFGYDVGFCIGF